MLQFVYASGVVRAAQGTASRSGSTNGEILERLQIGGSDGSAERAGSFECDGYVENIELNDLNLLDLLRYCQCIHV